MEESPQCGGGSITRQVIPGGISTAADGAESVGHPGTRPGHQTYTYPHTRTHTRPLPRQHVVCGQLQFAVVQQPTQVIGRVVMLIACRGRGCGRSEYATAERRLHGGRERILIHEQLP